jgi:hypothetical protein
MFAGVVVIATREFDEHARLIAHGPRIVTRWQQHHLSTDDLSAFSLPSFSGGIAGVASGLPFSFQGGFPRCLLGEFRIAGLLLGFQRGLASGNLGGLRSG